MIVVHHHEHSRSQRILWLLEELGLPYEIIRYARDPMTRLAPPELKAVHPLGKSPVIVDAGVTVAESAAIMEYVLEKHGNGRLRPKPGTPEWTLYVQWMHFSEGSAMLPLLLKLYVGLLGEAGAPLNWRIDSEIGNHFSFMEAHFQKHEWACGAEMTAADLQLSFPLEAGAARAGAERYPALMAYLGRLQARPAYQRALERGGPYQLLR